jgi:hypothetical protein
MYEDRNYNAVYALNSYLWKLIEANLGWKKSDYGTAQPIIPSAQQPELVATGNPFIVYGSAIQPVSHLYALRTESVSYNVYSESSTEANAVINLFMETFERQDEAARDVNEWLAVEGMQRPGGKRNVSFTSIKPTLSERAEAADTEGGYVAGFIMMEINYILEARTVQTTGFTYTP